MMTLFPFVAMMGWLGECVKCLDIVLRATGPGEAAHEAMVSVNHMMIKEQDQCFEALC